MAFPPNINPKTFTLSAVILGYILIDDFTANEQNAIANWFILVGQVMETNSSQQQLLNSRQQQSTTNNTSSFNHYKNSFSPDDLVLIKSAIHKMQVEIDKLMRENKKTE